jgi:hypothetical protein
MKYVKIKQRIKLFQGEKINGIKEILIKIKMDV